MNSIRVFTVVLITSMILLSGCFDKAEEPDFYQDLKGVVLSNGEPVEDAKIHIKNYFIPGGFVVGDDPKEFSELSLDVTLAGNYTIELYRFGSGDPITTVHEGHLDEDRHTFKVPASFLSNGVFVYVIVTPLNQVVQNVILINKKDEGIISTRPFTTTGEEGSFDIPGINLAIGNMFVRNGAEVEIGDSLQVIVVKDDQIIGRGRTQLSVKEEKFLEINID